MLDIANRQDAPVHKGSMIGGAGLSLLAAVLLVLSFPDWDIPFFCWPALVILFSGLKGQTVWRCFFLAFLFGVLFSLGVFHWILNVTHYRYLHHAILAVYLGAYYGLWGLGFGFIGQRLGRSQALWAAPFLWVALEYLRSHFFFLSLPWALIAHPLHHYPICIQPAALVGTYGLCFFIVFQASSLTAVVDACRYQHRYHHDEYRFFGKSNLSLIMIGLTSFALTILYGAWSLSRSSNGAEMRMGLIQANIEQLKKWDPKYTEEIFRVYTQLTRQAAKDQPDLIVWPETATPGSILSNPDIFDEISALVSETGIPLLFGSAQYQKFVPPPSTQLQRTNSVFLFHPDRESGWDQRYDKIRLFPFGEYLPYSKTFPWNLISVSSLSEYVPGSEMTLFKMPPYQFAVTICWENIFPDLVREFVKRGAQLVINITNEARFGKTAAPHQLVAISVFRAVENGIYIVRCANTGVSCIIDPHGRVVRKLQDDQKQDVFVRGILNGMVYLWSAHTLYTRTGDWVPIAAATGTLLFVIAAGRNRLWKKKSADDQSR